MSKPAIIIVPGSFALPELYDNLVEPITAKGYEIKALHPPSVSLKTGPREGIPPSMYDDAAFIAAEVEKLADQGKDVIVVAHSYGGVPTSQSTKGLGKEGRLKKGKKGGIVNLAYMTCLVPAIGVSAAGVLADVPQENKVDLTILGNGWMKHESVEKSAALAFSDLSKEEAEAWVCMFAHHSAVSFTSELTHAGYKDIPCSWLFCENDLVIPAKYQRAAIEMIEKVSGRKVDVTNIKGDHCPSVRLTAEVIDWIMDVAGKSSKYRVAG